MQKENYSKITFDLLPGVSSVKLVLTHTRFAAKAMYEHSDKNRKTSLDAIKRLAEDE